MKKYLLFFSLILIGSGIHAQPGIQVYGYEQESSKGTVASNIKDENGVPVKKPAIQKNYFIYLSFDQKYSIVPFQLFVKGKAFSIDTGTIDTTPVQHLNHNIPNNPEKITLVPKTINKVMELTIINPLPVKKTSTLQKLTTKNDIVISYAWKKKNYFAVLKKLKKLEPVLNE